MAQSLGPGQRLTLGVSGLMSGVSGSSQDTDLVRVSKSSRTEYEVLPLDVAKVTGNAELAKALPGI